MALTGAFLLPKHHPAISIVWQAGSICELPLPGLQRERGAVPQSGPVYRQAPGTRVCPPSSPDVAQHGHTITSYALLSYQA